MVGALAVPLGSTVGRQRLAPGIVAGQLHPANKHYNLAGQAVGVEDLEGEEVAGE